LKPTITRLVKRHKFDTDKATTVHSYGPWYDVALAPYRERPIRLLEIGVQSGGSLRLWDAYFDAALIVGVDVNPPKDDLSGIATFVEGDAYTEAMADQLGDFDIIVDDGPHTLVSMMRLIRLYLPRLNPGGLMVIEDVQDVAWFDYLARAVPDGCRVETVDRRKIKKRYDDLILAIWKPDDWRPLPVSAEAPRRANAAPRTSPALTCVVPTFNRPGLFRTALNGCLRQQDREGRPFPVQVILADDGDTDVTEGILREHYARPLDSGQIVHLKTGATEAWPNWRAGAEAATTDLVAWVQDDDRISKHYAHRIVTCFDEARSHGANPLVWMSRLDCSAPCGQFGLMYAFNGPIVPMPTMYGEREACHWGEGSPIAVSSYFTSMSLSPALAYKNGPEFRDALRRMPEGCDIFVERIIPAEMARHGGMITDPETIGYWRQHDDNLSRKQHADQPRQTGLLVAHLDDLLDRIGLWQEPFYDWLRVTPPSLILGWLEQLDTTEKEGGKSKHGSAIRHLICHSLEDRIRVGGEPRAPWWRRLAGKFASGRSRKAAAAIL
jgi:hypothetical protein